jgi:hypothetical protein
MTHPPDHANRAPAIREFRTLPNSVRVQRAWAEWLAQRDWHHYVSVSLPEGCSGQSAWRAFLGGVRRLESYGCRRINWLCAVEHGPSGQLPHFDALVSGTGRLDVAEVHRAWRRFSRIVHVRRYDAARGAVGYIAKEAGLEYGDIRLSRRLAPITEEAAA